MELSQEYKDFIKERYYHPEKAITNPAAFTSIWFHRGGEGRYGQIKSLIEDEIQRFRSTAVHSTEIKTISVKVKINKITFK